MLWVEIAFGASKIKSGVYNCDKKYKTMEHKSLR